MFLSILFLNGSIHGKAVLLNENAGLKNIEVTAIAKDKAGLMWVGTKRGLSKYDGYGFNAVPYFEKHTVNAIVYDSSRDVLWVGTDWGLFYIGCKDFRVVRCTPLSKKQEITCLVMQQREMIVGFKNNYILRIDSAFSCKVLYRFSSVSLWRERMVVDREGTIYCSFRPGSNLVKINGNTNESTVVMDKSSRSVDFLSLIEDEIYAGSVNVGFWNISHEDKSTWYLDTLNTIRQDPEFLLHHHQSMFIGYRNSTRVFEIKLKEKRIIDLSLQDADVFTNKRINCLYRDDFDVLWIGTSKGMIKLTPDKPKVVFEKLLVNRKVPVSTRQLIEDNNGDIYVASYAGFFRYNSEQRKWKNWPTINFRGRQIPFSPRSLLNVSEQYVYVGSDANFFGRFDKHKQSFELLSYYSSDSLCDTQGSILAMAQDARGVIWLGSDNSLLSLDLLQTKLTCHSKDKYAVDGATVKYIHIMPGKSQFWVGTEKGVFLMDSEKGRLLHLDETTTPALSDNNVNVITTDAFGNIYIGTDMGGLNVLSRDHNSIYTISRKDGLSSNEVYHLLWQDSTRLWMSTYNGLNYYHVPSKTIVSYYESDGTANNEFNQNSALKTCDGRLYFGGVKGITAINPTAMNTAAKPFSIFISAISKWDKVTETYQDVTIDDNNQINILPGDNLLTFSFAGSDYTAPELNTYFYKIEGLHSDWISLGTQPLLRLESLKGGAYQLHIKAVKGSRGDNSVNVLSYNLTIGQEFYKTLWFYILLALGLAGIIYIYFLNRLNTQKKLEHLRVQIASNLHDEVGSLLTRITMSADRLVARLSRDSETRDKLESVSQLSRAANAAMSDVLWAIDARNDVTGSLTDRMREHAEDLLLPRGIDVSIDFSEVDQLEKLSPEFRQNLFLLYKELINNILKHSHAGVVDIVYKQSKDSFMLRIQNDGVTMPAATVSTGQGLRNIKMRAELLKGKATIKHEGDTFEVIVSV